MPDFSTGALGDDLAHRFPHCVFGAFQNDAAQLKCLRTWQCAAYYKGASRRKNPFMPADVFADDPERLAIIAGEADLSPEHAREIIDQINFYPPNKHAFVASMCGRSCDTACYVHLEEKGVLKRKFKTPFRKRPVWELELD